MKPMDWVLNLNALLFAVDFAAGCAIIIFLIFLASKRDSGALKRFILFFLALTVLLARNAVLYYILSNITFGAYQSIFSVSLIVLYGFIILTASSLYCELLQIKGDIFSEKIMPLFSIALILLPLFLYFFPPSSPVIRDERVYTLAGASEVLVGLVLLYYSLRVFLAAKTLPKGLTRTLYQWTPWLVILEVPFVLINAFDGDGKLMEQVLGIPYGFDHFTVFYLLAVVMSAVFGVQSMLKSGQDNHKPIASRLSARELEVAQLIISGLSYQEIGDKLFISLKTVKTHAYRVYLKTGTRNKVELANLMEENRINSK